MEMAGENKLEKAFDLGYEKFLKKEFLRINVPDLPPYFREFTKVKFKPKQIVDRILLSKRKSIAFELKNTKRKLIPLTRIKKHQTEFLKEFKEKVGESYYLFGFNDFKCVFGVDIDVFLEMRRTLTKKSFNMKDIKTLNHIEIEIKKLRTNYRMNLSKFSSYFL